ncbi:hypothetical protein NE237_008939 [Protea cynaroides]|uniref:Exostosin GT47 domain-containing protein n=1 Tax=Protea cynaroides TaxID=273540 RepID=A0A9Q0KXM6_9MAGN|nr:hypothetical protein NE237_008939 [Protea cynaroides]
MDKSIGISKCRKNLLCIILSSIIFWFLFFRFHYSALISSNNEVRSLQNEYSIAESSTRSPLTENRVEPTGEGIKEQVMKNDRESPHPLHVEGNEIESTMKNHRSKPTVDPCSGQYVYVHSLPSRFNDDMLKDCRSLSMWTDMCRFTANMGLGPPISNSQGVYSNTGWYATNQFALDVIFHNRMKQYKCLTNDPFMASAIFVPFYAGFDISRYLLGFNTSMRDSTSIDLFKWLTETPEWKVLGGRDHFLVAGRMTWDFRRMTDNWGNKLMLLDEAKNMTMLVIESSPWNSNDFAIPYPTHFHPSRDLEVFQWQNKIRRFKRRYLFSFAGGPRPKLSGSIRGQIIDQCRASRRKCKMLECQPRSSKCDNPGNVMKIFQSSVFCLQPPGDSYTRRSAFDSILAGCIPVFFHPGSAYVQYIWHLPQNYKTYSVFISEIELREGKVSIEKRLLQIPIEQVRAMREQVIRLIPGVIYADPRSKLETLEDAFDLAVQGVIKRVDRMRKAISDGVDPDAESWEIFAQTELLCEIFARFFVVVLLASLRRLPLIAAAGTESPSASWHFGGKYSMK